MDESSAYVCPNCNQPVEVIERPDAGIVQCPHCGADFSLPEPAAPKATEDELDGLRIRQLASMRRATYRSRSHAIIAAAVCAVGTVQLLAMTIQHLRSIGWGVRPVVYLTLVPVALWGAWHFVGRATRLHQEAKHTSLPQPGAAPDFTSLSDGSRQVKNLEDIQ